MSARPAGGFRMKRNEMTLRQDTKTGKLAHRAAIIGIVS
jgi:hypothetical protein